MSNTNQELKITDMIRLTCDAMYRDKGMTEFSFVADDMAREAVKFYFRDQDISDDEVERGATGWVNQNQAEVERRFKSAFITPIITRHFCKYGKVAKVKVGRNDAAITMITVIVTDEEVPVKKRRSRKKVSLADCLDSFDVDVSKLSDSELMVRDVNEIVRQMKAHIEKCGL
ncbi:hypothetical protein Sf11_32 [Shigella phage Sfin-1]|uniref:Uncharacterized protein n=5 Tax=Tunavirus Sfin1 TaxID=2734026 RepID=A0A5Q5APW4_9CAUD|nr:hypothetical protein HOT52_gp32 [Shigella phage Sfin-1]QEA09619.1 hypothetical protein Sfin2_50 [Shigella phage Sfin-2]QGF19827.1 hypothetical protein Sfin4_0012 [Shigella phage Sfin-4]QGF20038.1 hypothetical protein Sfin5_0070 [Shigella phage Sfin-5]QGZ15963.1 hypothetical protein Sfin6_0055 [Shigella phage Sfin-6]ATN48435.1 hypothetical protein Sf11_32 [Shigella phage Sfin-1]